MDKQLQVTIGKLGNEFASGDYAATLAFLRSLKGRITARDFLQFLQLMADLLLNYKQWPLLTKLRLLTKLSKLKIAALSDLFSLQLPSQEQILFYFMMAIPQRLFIFKEYFQSTSKGFIQSFCQKLVDTLFGMTTLTEFHDYLMDLTYPRYNINLLLQIEDASYVALRYFATEQQGIYRDVAARFEWLRGYSESPNHMHTLVFAWQQVQSLLSQWTGNYLQRQAQGTKNRQREPDQPATLANYLYPLILWGEIVSSFDIPHLMSLHQVDKETTKLWEIGFKKVLINMKIKTKQVQDITNFVARFFTGLATI